MKALFIAAVLLIGVIVPVLVVVFHAKIKAQSVELAKDWSVWVKQWSVWLNVTAAAFGTWLLASPDFFIHLWAQIPDEWKASIPPEYVKLLPLAFVVASTVVSNIKQQKLSREQAAKNAVPVLDSVPVQADVTIDRSRNFIGSNKE